MLGAEGSERDKSLAEVSTAAMQLGQCYLGGFLKEEGKAGVRNT